jgi:hypothetical protein
VLAIVLTYHIQQLMATVFNAIIPALAVMVPQKVIVLRVRANLASGKMEHAPSALPRPVSMELILIIEN